VQLQWLRWELSHLQQLNGDKMEPEFTEEIDNQTLTGFYVTNIPRGVFREFKKLCKENFGDIYWVGISELLKTKKKYEELSALIFSMQQQINDLKKINSPEVKLQKTFGG
jgi:hypothetical protein